MRTLMAALMFGLFFCLSGLALAGPFGTEMGQTPEQFTNLKTIKVTGPKAAIYSLYSTDTLPKMNDTFNHYTLLFGKHGLAKVVASSKIYPNDEYGIHVREEYETLKKQLIKKYGKPKSYDLLKKGSIWKEDNEFVMAIRCKDRVLASLWENNLPNNLKSILLEVNAGLLPDDTQLTLGYEYENFHSIAEELTKSAEDAL